MYHDKSLANFQNESNSSISSHTGSEKLRQFRMINHERKVLSGGIAIENIKNFKELQQVNSNFIKSLTLRAGPYLSETEI